MTESTRWIVFKCTGCSAILIAKEGQVSKQCTYCNSWLTLYAMVTKEVKDWRTTVPKRQHIKHRSNQPAVKILATVNSFDKASDAARYLKLPEANRKNEENFISSAWRD